MTFTRCSTGDDRTCVERYMETDGRGADTSKTCCWRTEVIAVPPEPTKDQIDYFNIVQATGLMLHEGAETWLCLNDWTKARPEGVGAHDSWVDEKTGVTLYGFCDSAIFLFQTLTCAITVILAFS